MLEIAAFVFLLIVVILFWELIVPIIGIIVIAALGIAAIVFLLILLQSPPGRMFLAFILLCGCIFALWAQAVSRGGWRLLFQRMVILAQPTRNAEQTSKKAKAIEDLDKTVEEIKLQNEQARKLVLQHNNLLKISDLKEKIEKKLNKFSPASEVMFLNLTAENQIKISVDGKFIARVLIFSNYFEISEIDNESTVVNNRYSYKAPEKRVKAATIGELAKIILSLFKAKIKQDPNFI